MFLSPEDFLQNVKFDWLGKPNTSSIIITTPHIELMQNRNTAKQTLNLSKVPA
jgi:hypothetical protein